MRRIRLSSPCSRIRSSAGEICSPSFFAKSRFGWPMARTGVNTATPAIELWRKKFRRLGTGFDILAPWSRKKLDVRREQRVRRSRCRIDPQHLYKLGHLAQMPQGVPCRLVIAAQEIHIEDILPGSPTHGTGLDLAQANVAQREHAK